MDLLRLTMPEFAGLEEKSRGAILPVGAVEQHGPHLPLGFDAMHAHALALAAAELHPCLVAPPLYYGLCRSTSQHPGTVGIPAAALQAVVVAVGESLWAQGLRYLCLLTGHAGGTHQAALLDAGERLLATTGLELASVCVLDLIAESGEPVATPGDSHAGEVETSLGLHLWPELVKGTAPEEYPSFPKYLLTRDKRTHWPGGVWATPAGPAPQRAPASSRPRPRDWPGCWPPWRSGRRPAPPALRAGRLDQGPILLLSLTKTMREDSAWL